MENLYQEFMTTFKDDMILGYEQIYNSVGELTDLLRSDELSSEFDIFLQDGVGSFIAFWNLPNNSRPIVYFNSEGSPFAVIAKDFKEFLSLLYLGEYSLNEIGDYTRYLNRKKRHAINGYGFVGEEPTGMSEEEIKKWEDMLKEEYENYDEVIAWLKNNGIERPASFYNQIINAYKEMPNLQDFLDEKLGEQNSQIVELKINEKQQQDYD